ncbi:MAG: hypothetical protein IPP73_19805 [Chitinophagaceae bacterium]|nr:hypothetical protein [Chitinophagaceae bacterium]
MKKIKSIHQLKEEKKRLKHRQAELESRIRGNWTELKSMVKPAGLAKDLYCSMMNGKAAEKTCDSNVVGSTINFFFSSLAKKITEKAGEKLNSLFGKKDKH